jgi:hypothetical protein
MSPEDPYQRRNTYKKRKGAQGKNGPFPRSMGTRPPKTYGVNHFAVRAMCLRHKIYDYQVATLMMASKRARYSSSCHIIAINENQLACEQFKIPTQQLYFNALV